MTKLWPPYEIRRFDGIHEKEIDFQKESTVYGNNYYGKEEGRPYSFAQLAHKFLIGKGSLLAKSQCIYPQSSKTVFMNTGKKSRLIESTLCCNSLF